MLSWILTGVLVGYIPVFFFESLKKHRKKSLLLFIAVSSGLYGFLVTPIAEYTFLNALYSTFRLFILDVDSVFSEGGSKFTQLPLAIEIARWSGAAYTITTVFSILYMVFSQSIKLFSYKLFGKHIVISGYSEKVKTLAESFQRDFKKVVLLTEEISKTEKNYLKELGVIVLVGKQGDPQLYKRAQLLRADYFIIFHEEDSKNLDEYLALAEFLKTKEKLGKLKRVILHISYQQSYELFEEVELQIRKDNKPASQLSVKTMNIHRLTAEHLLNQYPLYHSYKQRLRDPLGAPLHLLFIGFGRTGQQLALNAIERSHFMNPEPISITVLDKDAKRVEKRWKDNYPKNHKVVNLSFKEVDISIDSVDDYILSSEQPFTHIFLCLQDDYQDIMEGINLAKAIPDIPVYLRVKNQAKIGHWLHNNEDRFNNLILFGNNGEVLTYDNVINDQLEEAAQFFHEGYRKKKESETGKVQKKWNELSTFMKESNRNLYNHAHTKLMLLGLKAVSIEDEEQNTHKWVTEEEFKAIAFSSLERLAAAEHARWNTFHFLKGWDVLENVTKEYSKDETKKLHSCLVSYEDLDKIKQITEEDYKQYDRENILDLHAALKEVGYGIVKE